MQDVFAVALFTNQGLYDNYINGNIVFIWIFSNSISDGWGLSETVKNASIWPLIAYIVAVIFQTVLIIALSSVLGQRHKERSTGQPFESGIAPTGSARLRFSAKFYLIAMFFVIFDLESVFIFAWAAAVPELGWAGYIEILIFIAVLLATLGYLWRMGALNWSPRRRKAQETP